MTKEQLKKNFFIAMGPYATHRKEILSFDSWHKAVLSIKNNKYAKEIKLELDKLKQRNFDE